MNANLVLLTIFMTISAQASNAEMRVYFPVIPEATDVYMICEDANNLVTYRADTLATYGSSALGIWSIDVLFNRSSYLEVMPYTGYMVLNKRDLQGVCPHHAAEAILGRPI